MSKWKSTTHDEQDELPAEAKTSAPKETKGDLQKRLAAIEQWFTMNGYTLPSTEEAPPEPEPAEPAPAAAAD